MSERVGTWPADEILSRLSAAYGAPKWWPADGPLEVLIGAVLTQAVRWQNVTTAISRLKERTPLVETALLEMPWQDLVTCLRPTRFPNQKGRRLLAVLEMVTRHGQDSLADFFARTDIDHREALLAVPGVGAETADAILLYAGLRRAFPIDAYTRRIASRLLGNAITDHQLRQQTLARLPRVGQLSDLHGLLVIHAQRHCLARRRCHACPLAMGCRGRQEMASA